MKNVVVLAPTGVAAVNVEGQTIHSFFGLPPELTEDIAKEEAEWCTQVKKKIINKTQTIIIDEISMVRADLLDCIDIYLRIVLENDLPFGGKQMIFIGDLYQLPPVLKNSEYIHFSKLYKTTFFYGSKVFKNILQDEKIEYVELEKVYRQKNKSFIQILNRIREGDIDPQLIERLNKRVINKEKIEELISIKEDSYKPIPIYITSLNAISESVNNKQLKEIKKDSGIYKADIEGKFDKQYYPADETLELKEGARIMMLNNDQKRRWINGTLGYVKKVEEEEIEVILDNGHKCNVSKYTWDLSKLEFNTKNNKLEKVSIGSFTQIPCKLAWAITIHKSQGKTFDNIIIDLGRGSFSSGQTYVALSRCTSLKGVYLTKDITRKDIIIEKSIKYFLEYLNRMD